MKCGWAVKEPNLTYHDKVWGRPEYDDTKLFEYLILESAQAGLSWEMILKRQEDYRQAFKNYELEKLVLLSDEDLEEIKQNYNIIKNKRKIASVRQNAKAFQEVQKKYGSFSKLIWSYVNDKPIVNNPKSLEEVPSETELSKQISKDLKKLGFNFVGPTIVYSYLQAIGVVDDHLVTCPSKTKNNQ